MLIVSTQNGHSIQICNNDKSMKNSTTFISRLKLLRCAELGSSPMVVGRIWVHGKGKVRIGNRVRLDASNAPIEFYTGPGAEVILGDDVDIQGGTSFEVYKSVQVGDGCKIGERCKLLDNSFHRLSKRTERPQSGPIVVEAGATLENDAIILPGARVASGKVIARGAVVRGRPEAGGATAEIEEWHGNVVKRFLRRLQAEPFKVVQDVVSLARGAILFRSCERGARVYAHGPVRIKNQGAIRLGTQVGFCRGMIPSELICHPGAEISIGDGTFFNYASSIEARQSVTIGKRCMFASRVRLADASDRTSGPIIVGDDVWIAHGAVIAPGISIGAASVISAGAVVTKDVPPYSLAIGNPARCISMSLFVPN